MVRRATRDQRGQLGGIEGVAFGVLVFVIGALVIANAWAVVDAKVAASAAAREAARVFVEADDADNGDAAAASAAAAALAGYGRDPARMTVDRGGDPFGRCRRVTFTVTYPVAVGSIPLIGRAATTFVVAARHSELIDPFRAGLGGEARCDP